MSTIDNNRQRNREELVDVDGRKEVDANASAKHMSDTLGTFTKTAKELPNKFDKIVMPMLLILVACITYILGDLTVSEIAIPTATLVLLTFVSDVKDTQKYLTLLIAYIVFMVLYNISSNGHLTYTTMLVSFSVLFMFMSFNQSLLARTISLATIGLSAFLVHTLHLDSVNVFDIFIIPDIIMYTILMASLAVGGILVYNIDTKTPVMTQIYVVGMTVLVYNILSTSGSYYRVALVGDASFQLVSEVIINAITIPLITIIGAVLLLLINISYIKAKSDRFGKHNLCDEFNIKTLEYTRKGETQSSDHSHKTNRYDTTSLTADKLYTELLEAKDEISTLSLSNKEFKEIISNTKKVAELENKNSILKHNTEISALKAKDDINKVSLIESKVEINRVKSESKAELNRIKAETKIEITNIKTEAKADVNNAKEELNRVKADAKNDIANVKAEAKNDIANVKSEAKIETANVKAELNRVKSEARVETTNVKADTKSDITNVKAAAKIEVSNAKEEVTRLREDILRQKDEVLRVKSDTKTELKILKETHISETTSLNATIKNLESEKKLFDLKIEASRNNITTSQTVSKTNLAIIASSVTGKDYTNAIDAVIDIMNNGTYDPNNYIPTMNLETHVAEALSIYVDSVENTFATTRRIPVKGITNATARDEIVDIAKEVCCDPDMQVGLAAKVTSYLSGEDIEGYNDATKVFLEALNTIMRVSLIHKSVENNFKATIGDKMTEVGLTQKSLSLTDSDVERLKLERPNNTLTDVLKVVTDKHTAGQYIDTNLFNVKGVSLAADGMIFNNMSRVDTEIVNNLSNAICYIAPLTAKEEDSVNKPLLAFNSGITHDGKLVMAYYVEEGSAIPCQPATYVTDTRKLGEPFMNLVVNHLVLEPKDFDLVPLAMNAVKEDVVKPIAQALNYFSFMNELVWLLTDRYVDLNYLNTKPMWSQVLALNTNSNTRYIHVTKIPTD